jgi:hypothetical protein
MNAIIVPFPITKRRDFIKRNATRIAEAQPKTAEKLLAHAINIQSGTMVRRGIDPELVAHQARAFEAAIRAELWRLIIREGDTA